MGECNAQCKAPWIKTLYKCAIAFTIHHVNTILTLGEPEIELVTLCVLKRQLYPFLLLPMYSPNCGEAEKIM